MTVGPVIVRELRSQARQPLTYWLRVVAAGAAFGMLGFVLLQMYRAEVMWAATARGALASGANPFSGFGALLFGQLNATIFVCNCLLAPLLTADCISREKREGTFGLLFLTKLNAAGIVFGKAFVHTLRGLAMFAAMLPVLAIPVLAGGVSGKDCVMAVLIDGIVLIFGLAAGLLASAVSRDWVRSFVLAEFLSVFLVLVFMFGHFEILQARIGGTVKTLYHSGSALGYFLEVFCFHTNFAKESTGWTSVSSSPAIKLTTGWSDIWAGVASIQSEWFFVIVSCLAVAILIFVLAIVLAAQRIRRSWRQEAGSPKMSKLQRSFTQPRFAVQFLRRRLSRSLSRNPIGWLQHYSWTGRITKWGWFAVLLTIECLVSSDLDDFERVQPRLALLLLAGIAFTASASFRKDRESGALELLLVCPLSVSQIIGGRLRGLWMQFLPGAALLILCLAVTTTVGNEEMLNGLYMLVAFATVPVVGLFFSMTRLNSIVAWLLTILFGILMPWFATLASQVVLELFLSRDFAAHMLLLQAAAGILFWQLLYGRLKNRRFAFVHF
jgi:ABC-type transport system involved in cytochrome c biogenesis permease component